MSQTHTRDGPHSQQDRKHTFLQLLGKGLPYGTFSLSIDVPEEKIKHQVFPFQQDSQATQAAKSISRGLKISQKLLICLLSYKLAQSCQLLL